MTLKEQAQQLIELERRLTRLENAVYDRPANPALTGPFLSELITDVALLEKLKRAVADNAARQALGESND